MLLLCSAQVRSDLFLNLGSLTHAVTQVVELRAANLTDAGDFNLCYVGRVNGEGLLHAYTVGNTSYGKGLGDTAAVLSDHSTLEKLNSFFGALHDLVVDTDGVTDADNRHLCLQLLVCKSLNQVHFMASFKIRMFMQSFAADHP